MTAIADPNRRNSAFEILFGATLHRRVLSRSFAAIALQSATVGFLGVAIGHPDHPAVLAAASAMTLAVAGALFLADVRFTVYRSFFVLVGAGVVLLAACYGEGTSNAPILVSLAVASAAVGFALYRRADALVLCLICLVSEALFFFVLVPDVPNRVLIFVYGTSLATIIACFTTFVVTKIHRLAEAEQAALADAERTREALEEANRHKSAFLASMSHELRTPLNAVIGFSDVLDERLFGDLNDKQAEYVADIRSSGEHLLSLVNDTLDHSKVEAGHMELDASEVGIGALTTSVVSLFRDQATRRNVSLDADVSRDAGTLRADERKLRQVLVNLVANALKFTPEGGRVQVAAVRTDGHVVLSVADTGPGIASDQQEHIFEEFAQLRANGGSPGTGLGLALARRLTELHGGQLTVDSAPGRGATFTMSLPAWLPNAPGNPPPRR
ncbi:MAG: hypothetical protein JO265_12190 [Acidimicrobiia bacterium]|nr:hypothetical protein [Acidimicrobiia bacterium]